MILNKCTKEGYMLSWEEKDAKNLKDDGEWLKDVSSISSVW